MFGYPGRRRREKRNNLIGKTVTEDRLEELRLQQEMDFDAKVLNRMLPDLMEGKTVMGTFTEVLGEPVQTDAEGNVLHLDVLIEGGQVVGKAISEHGKDSVEARRALHEWSNAYRFLQRTGQMA